MEDLIWKSNDAAIVFSVGTATICFSVYWFAAYSNRLRNLVDNRRGAGHFNKYGAFYQKVLGITLLGVVPALVAIFFLPGSLSDYGFGLESWQAALYWVLILGGVVTFIPRYSAKKEEMLEFYPQVRVAEWSRSLLLTNGVFWVAYLTAYEFLFRGFLLINIADALGWWPAIVISTSLATITHFPKGGKETFGTIPLSILLCLIVVQTGSIWPCIIIHSLLAISNDYWALSYHPHMTFKTPNAEKVEESVS